MDLDEIGKCYRLKPLRVEPRKLILDPHNPRISLLLDDPLILKKEIDIASDAVQKAVFSVLQRPEFLLNELIASIRARGFTNAGEQMIVERHGNDGHYLVLEGNRRTAALSRLRGIPGMLSTAVRESIAEIDVQEFSYVHFHGGLSKRDVIETLLGQIHVAGKLSWGAMERAEYVYHSYCRISRTAPEDLYAFDYDVHSSGKVSEIFGCSVRDVRKTIIIARNYFLLRSLGADVRPGHYSLIDLATSTRSVSKDVFGLSDEYLHFSKHGAKRFAELCIEEDRFIHNPKDFRTFAKVYQSGDANLISAVSERSISIEQAGERLQRIAARDEFENELGRAIEIAEGISVGAFRGTQAEKKLILKIVDIVDRRLKPLLRG
jgi:hypothetical protein